MVRFAGLLAIFVSVLIGSAVAAGRLLGEPPGEIAALAECDLPCWRGIVPGETTGPQARRRLMALGCQKVDVDYVENPEFFAPPAGVDCQIILDVDLNADRVRGVTLASCGRLLLGDVMLALRGIDGVNGAAVSFRRALAVARLQVGICPGGLRPAARVVTLEIAPHAYYGTQAAFLAGLRACEEEMSDEG